LANDRFVPDLALGTYRRACPLSGKRLAIRYDYEGDSMLLLRPCLETRAQALLLGGIVQHGAFRKDFE